MPRSNNLTLLESSLLVRAKRQNNNAIWSAYVQGLPYSPWSSIDFTGWEWI